MTDTLIDNYVVIPLGGEAFDVARYKTSKLFGMTREYIGRYDSYKAARVFIMEQNTLPYTMEVPDKKPKNFTVAVDGECVRLDISGMIREYYSHDFNTVMMQFRLDKFNQEEISKMISADFFRKTLYDLLQNKNKAVPLS